MNKIFLDTNLFIYALDPGDARKRALSRNCIERAMDGRNGVISTQVLQEYFVVATRKLGVAPLDAKRQMAAMGRLETILVTPTLIHTAIDVCALEGFSFWVSLILTTAQSAGCAQLYTEDLTHGQMARGVEVINPLLE